MADVMEEYQSSLEDLTFNSKPHINMLTILADENKNHAENVVRLIEAQIFKASEKLPLLYLLDSIIKNVGENYKPLFARNLTSIFKRSFQSADDKSKMSMYKLRSTWDNYFPLKKLHSLDMTIKELDPNWPVKSLPSHLQDNATTNIHVNPKFIKKNEPSQLAISVKPSTKAVSSKSAEVDKIRQQLMRQQKELLDLQQKKLILELEQTKQELAVKTIEAHKTNKKVQDKATKDPRNTHSIGSIGSLRVTLSNNKAPASDISTSKDPRLKQSAISPKKDTALTNAAAKSDSAKLNQNNAKKKLLKTSVKKDKSVSPKTSPFKTKSNSHQQPEKMKSIESNVKKPKDKVFDNKSAPPVESKKQKRVNRSKSPGTASPTQPKVPRIASTPELSSEKRRKLKLISDKMEQSKNQRIQRLKLQSKDSSRSSESSLSPRFSPEPESDESLHPDMPVGMPPHRREDGLRRRPSFDPDLHIPKELTLSHQNEILKQADHQLRTGQLTHRQHQELLKQLHQLFEVQRMKKMQAPDERFHDERHFPLDPRQTKRMRGQKLPPDRRNVENQELRQAPPTDVRKPVKRARDPNIPSGHRDPRGFRRLPPRDQDSTSNRRPPMHRPPGLVGSLQERKALSKHQRSPRPLPSEMSRVKKQGSYPLRGGLSENRPRMPRRPDLARGDSDKQPPIRPPPLIAGEFDQRKASRDYRPSVKDQSKISEQKSVKVVEASEFGEIEPPPRPPLSPPPFFVQHSSSSALSESDGGVSSENLSEKEQQKSLRQYALSDSSQIKELTIKDSQEKRKQALLDDTKEGPEEPEDYIIASMPTEESEAPKQLEEPEDYIIAGMKEDSIEEKNPCEEPEDFIIAQMPPGAEAYHNHSMGLKRNSDSEKAYLDHMKKIKQSMYSKELTKSRRMSSQSDSTSTAEESASEKPTVSGPPKKGDTRSPSLPPKKRKYFDSDTSSKTKEIKEEKPSIQKDDGVKKIELNENDKKVSEIEIKKEDVQKEDIENKKSESAPKEKKTNDAKQKPSDKRQRTVSPKSNIKTKSTAKPSNVKESSKSKEKKEESSKPSKVIQTDQADKKVIEKRSQNELSNDEADIKRFPVIDETSSVYVIEDEDLEETQPEKNLDSRHSQRPTKRPFPPHHPPEEWRRNLTFEQVEEARIQKLMQEEQAKLEWESNLTRKLEMEQWKEEQMRRDHHLRGRGRGRVRLPPPGRWKSPPREGREPESFDIARGKIFRRTKNMPRPRPHRPGEDPLRMHHPFPPQDDIRIRRHRPLSPGPPPGWDPRRPRTPPGRRPPPGFHDDRMEWDRIPGRLPPREMLPPDEEHRTPPPLFEQPRRVPNEPATVLPINQVNVNKLLADLVDKGIIPGSKKPDPKDSSPVSPVQPTDNKPPPPNETSQTTPPTGNEPEPNRSVSPFIEEDLMVLDPDAELPVISLTSDLKIRHDEIIKRIYTGIQCSACGLRFTTRQTDLYADHLDWHYRLNRKDKEGSSLSHRELYPAAGDWICFEEIENPQERAKNSFFDDIENPDSIQKLDEDLTVPLTGKPGEDVCKVCKEAFETFYNENDDEWQFANCVKVDDDNFHPNCYGDYKDQLTPATPLLSPTDEETRMELPMESESFPQQTEIKAEIEEDSSTLPATEPMDVAPILAESEDSQVSITTAQVNEPDSSQDNEIADVEETSEVVIPTETIESSTDLVTAEVKSEPSDLAASNQPIIDVVEENLKVLPDDPNVDETVSSQPDIEENSTVEMPADAPPSPIAGSDEKISSTAAGDHSVTINVSNSSEL